MSLLPALDKLLTPSTLDLLQTWPWLQIILLGLVLTAMLSFLHTTYRPGLRNLPGPFWARHFQAWRMVFALDGTYPFKLIKLHDKHGSLVRIGPNHVSVSDPEEIPNIYGYNTRYAKGPFYTAMTGQHEGSRLDNIFSVRDPHVHKILKSQIMNRYTPASIKALEPMMDDCTDDFIEIMTNRAGEKVNLGQWLHWYAADVIGELTFQKRFGFMEKQKDVRGMIFSMEMAAVYGTFIGQIPFFHRFMLGSEWTMDFIKWLFPKEPQLFNEMVNITGEEMEKNAKRGVPKTRPDFLQWLTEDMESGKGGMSQRELLSHVAANLLGGSDTTSSSMRAIFYRLIKSPEVYKKVVAEILEADANGQLSERITYAESMKMTYLQVAIKEAMRLTPAIGAQFERVVPPGGDVISGQRLPGGTVVGASALVIHHNKELYGEDADVYRPERWLEASEEKLKKMEKAFFTFGYGARVCTGKNIGLTEVGKFVPRILRKFDIEWASDQPEWTLKYFWFAVQEGMIVRFKPRTNTKIATIGEATIY